MLTQCDQILQYMKLGNSITPLEALEKFGCFRLGARIWDLKRAGYKIQSAIVSDKGKHFSRYWI